MRICAITVYAGSEPLVEMTESMLKQFRECHGFKGKLMAFNNGAARSIDQKLVDWQGESPTNLGFGKAVNWLIEMALFVDPTEQFSHVLVLNNDLEFPERSWLVELLKEAKGTLVLSPCTDRTATKEALAKRGFDKPPIRCGQVSAFCWLVPVDVIKSIRAQYGYNLFDPDFFAYGEDDYAGAVLRKKFNRQPFKVVPRSWVRHLKGKTGKEMGMGGGMPKNLALLAKKVKKLR
tara:strand:- start:8591 stop:9292 length:702 start_codon:yes stop_codon:yes gene_type:complete